MGQQTLSPLTDKIAASMNFSGSPSLQEAATEVQVNIKFFKDCGIRQADRFNIVFAVNGDRR